MAVTTKKILSLVRVIGNCALLNSVGKNLYTDLSDTNYIPNAIDLQIAKRLEILTEYKIKGLRSVHSKDIYSGICSSQNWYYRILTNKARLVWILKKVFTEVAGRALALQLDHNQNEKSLYTKTNRANYSEGLRRLRYMELCIFLNFTTND